MRRGRAIDDATDGTAWYDPAIFPDAAKAAERIRVAAEHGETVALFGDYDCDGITSSAQMVRALRRRGIEPIVRLPHRVHDGYGMKSVHIDEFLSRGVTLIITVDTGISAHEAVEKAAAAGVDVIILDHHHLTTVPPAFAVIHPALAPGFPEPHPSAAGVVFMFLHALENGMWEDRDTDLALAMFGTVADLVPLRGGNRRLVQEGLNAVRRLPPSAVRLFVDQISGGKSVSSTDIAFRIAPRINAAGRMADPMIALHALLEGGTHIGDLETLNALRQDQTSRALDKAMIDMPLTHDGALPAFISIASGEYPHGILGLLSGKLTEKHGRPSMAVHIADGICTASLRSTPQYNIVEGLHRHASMLMNFGGHAQAAGATFALDQYIPLVAALELDVQEHVAEDDLVPVLSIDAMLPAAAVTRDFCAQVRSLEPFGQGNPEPLFLVRNLQLEQLRRVGSDSKHLQGYAGNCKVIGFGLGEYAPQALQRVDVLCRVGIDTWNGKETPQLFLVDMRAAVTANQPLSARF